MQVAYLGHQYSEISSQEEQTPLIKFNFYVRLPEIDGVRPKQLSRSVVFVCSS